MSKQTKNTKQANDDAFVSDDVVGSGKASYFKLETGDNEVRLISKPITGWIAWGEDEEGNKKPTRTPITEEPDDESDGENPPKKFMACVVIDAADDEVKIWEITQQSIIKAIKALSSNPKWGNPFTYSLSIEKKGEGMKTRYTVNPNPKAPISKAAIKVASEKPCNLDALYEGADPWDEKNHDTVTEYHFE